MDDWRQMLERMRHPAHEVTIGFVGKYVKHRDAYKSVYEALDHAGIHHHAKVRVVRHRLGEARPSRGPRRRSAGVDGLLVPGGFDKRGIEGKIEAIRFARETGLPFFGICLGLQCATIEFARNVVGLAGCEQHRVQQGDAAPGRVPAGRAASGDEPRRHAAARGVSVPPAAGHARPTRRTGRRWSANGTGTATR